MAARVRSGLVTARKRRGHTQESLAYALDVEQSTVGRWERGTTDPLPLMWPRIAQELGITTDELVGFLAKPCCERCGKVLAADNTTNLCGICRRDQHGYLDAPPRLGNEFFDTAEFWAAFESQHIGRVLKAYRTHPYFLEMFTKPLSQENLGRWLGLNQTQMSKLENGKAEQNLETLQEWAAILHLPPHMLWFDMPGHSRRSFLVASGAAAIGATLSSPSQMRIMQALEMVASDDVDSLDAATDCLDELVAHYSEKLSVTPPVEIYQDLLSVRSFAGSLVARSKPSTRRRADVVAASGWLSSLLAVATSYTGDHGSALIWCVDAERHSHESGNHEIAGWSALTRAMMAYYQGRTGRSIELASSGQQVAPRGTAARAKLAAHEMRARAMLGDGEGMIEARERATAAMTELPSSGVPASGVFSIALSEDPPYTATSLLLLNRFQEAQAATENVIQSAYPINAYNRNRKSSNFARTLLILGLSKAGLGDIDGAVAAGLDALTSTSLVWPTLVLAGKLDNALRRDHKTAIEVVEYHSLYMNLADAATKKFKDPSLLQCRGKSG